MNIERAKLPWHRQYNWRMWWQQEYQKHKRALFLLLIAIIVWLVFALEHWIEEHYLAAAEATMQARIESAKAMSLRMSGAPKTPEDHIVFKEPVGWKLAHNWCKMGWEKEC